MLKKPWIPIFGAPVAETKGGLLFHGGITKTDEQEGERILVGMYVTSETFTGGSIRMVFRAEDASAGTGAEIIARYDPLTRSTLNVGIPGNGYPLMNVREWNGARWLPIAGIGEHTSLKAAHDYEIRATLRGSLIAVNIDGVELIRANLPTPFSQSQVGFFCMSPKNILIKEFEIQKQRIKAFVVMQFSAPYNDVYMEVIKSVCSELEVDVLRIDETNGPGLIISDISRAILESTLIIADISPLNANVFYEVGYAHGINKPTILIAEKGTKLPFDVSPFRTLFYENTIAGKTKLENGLRNYIKTILNSRDPGRTEVSG